jgi:diguanylate cyclase (GGDEF)-like protein
MNSALDDARFMRAGGPGKVTAMPAVPLTERPIPPSRATIPPSRTIPSTGATNPPSEATIAHTEPLESPPAGPPTNLSTGPSAGQEPHNPFGRATLLNRSLPFAAVAVFAELSLVLPPGPKSAVSTALSLALLAVVIGAVIVLPWERLPDWSTVFVPVGLVGSVLALVLAFGSPMSGVGIVILIPLIWSVLFHRRWESYVVVGAIVVAEVVTSLTPMRVTDPDLFRRTLFWLAIGILVTVSTHGLRDRVRTILADRTIAQQRSESLAIAAAELSGLLTSDEVITTATRFAAELVSPHGTPGRRAQYTRVVGSQVFVAVEYDETGDTVSVDLPLSEHPILLEVLETGAAVNRLLIAEAAGPEVQKLIVTLGLTHVVYVPVYYDGAIDGVLTVPVRGQPVSPDLFEYCKALGHVTELALRNARTHELLLAQATTDDLTGLPNRRAFDRLVAQRPGRLEFCVLALDLDGLKLINDAQGHSVGDQLLVHFAQVVSQTLRQGDMFARLGGDEFAVLLFNATVTDGTDTAARMLAALDEAPFQGKPLGVSIGVAAGSPDGNGLAVCAMADAAMYRAKRSGGRCCIVAQTLADGVDR